MTRRRWYNPPPIGSEECHDPELTYLHGFNLNRTRALLMDLTPEQMVAQFSGVIESLRPKMPGHLPMIADDLGIGR